MEVVFPRGLKFKNPLALLSGCVGFGDEYTRIKGFNNGDYGAVFLKGTTLKARVGNEPHRVYETSGGMLNSIGLQNPGARFVVDNILPALDMSDTCYIANISGSTVEEYAEVATIFSDSQISAIEINISCPNVKAGGAIFGNDPEMSAKVVAACRKVTDKPLIAKLSPNQADIADNALRCVDAGADALAVINTLTGMAVDITTGKPVLGNNIGGLSGPAIKPVALLKVSQVYQRVKNLNIPIIGQGGVTTAEDALEFIIAGASAVGIGTALFYDAFAGKKILSGIEDYLATNGIQSLSALTGSLSLNT